MQEPSKIIFMQSPCTHRLHNRQRTCTFLSRAAHKQTCHTSRSKCVFHCLSFLDICDSGP